MDGPLVSVCIPTYRGARFLGATIDSVLSQSYPYFELLIVDDNSPDDTRDIVAAYADERIRYHRNDSNQGPQGNWNRCLQLAQGEFFKLLPHDDLLASDCLETQVAVFQRDQTPRSISLVFGLRRIVDAHGKVIMQRGLSQTPAGRVDRHALVRRCVRAGGNLIGEPGNGLARMSDARAVGSFDATWPYVIDLDFWFRLLKRGDAYYTATWASTFRLSPESWSVAIGRRQYADFNGLMKRARSEFGFAISGLDLLIGALAARASTLARLLVYAVVFRRKPG